MADQLNPGHEPKPTSEERPFFSLSRDDQCILWITFVGGLASILVGAVIIGGAIALARYPNPKRAQLGNLAGITAASLGLIVLALLLGYLDRWFNSSVSRLPRFLRPSRLQGRDRFFLIYGRILGVIGGVFLAFCLLVWLGMAAGIK